MWRGRSGQARRGRDEPLLSYPLPNLLLLMTWCRGKDEQSLAPSPAQLLSSSCQGREQLLSSSCQGRDQQQNDCPGPGLRGRTSLIRPTAQNLSLALLVPVMSSAVGMKAAAAFALAAAVPADVATSATAAAAPAEIL